MKTKIRTVPDLSSESLSHQEAIKEGDAHFWRTVQNVEDRFKGMSNEEIMEFLQKTSHPFAVCFEHWTGDFNISTGIRNANAFNAKEVFYIGTKKWDRRGAVGVHNYTQVNFLPTIDDLVSLQEKYTFIGIDNIPGSVPLSDYKWNRNTLMIFGEEGVGLTPGAQKLCKELVYIEQFGSVRSLNCGTASGIVMNDFVTKYRKGLLDA